jgi:hypothetical protein
MESQTIDYTSVVLVISGLVFVSLLTWWLWPREDTWSRVVRYWRDEYLDQYSDAEDPGQLPNLGQSAIVRLAVAHLRTELGCLTDSSANRMVVSDVVRRFMKNHGMRPTHISYYFAICVDVYSLQSTADEQLTLIRKSAAYRKLRRTGGTA